MHLQQTLIGGGLGLAIAALGACDQVKKLDEEPGDGGVPAAVQQRLDTYCAIPGGCHTPGATPPDMSAGASGALLTMSSRAGPPFVEIGNIEGSQLITRIAPGGGMPTAASLQLTPEDSAILYAWVAGAPFPDDGTGGGTDTAPTTTMVTMTTMASTTGMDMGTTSDSDTASEPVACDLATVDPAATNPIDAGDAAGQIPTSIGEILAANCGCHYATTAVPPYVAFALPMNTLAGFDELVVSGITLAASTIVRVRDEAANPESFSQMPQMVCDVDGMDTRMVQADRDLLISWLEADTPDGATFVE